jgi:hypothetical protein
MSEDMTTNGFATICASEQSACTWIALHLVGQENGDIELWNALTR